MPSTLISAIGIGSKLTDGKTYRRVSYRIAGSDQPPTCFFVEAWLRSAPGADIDRVVLVGTSTSSWAALAEDDEALFFPLCERIDLGGVSTEDLEPLTSHLSQRWGRKVEAVVLSQGTIDDTVADEIVACLMAFMPLSEPDRGLVLDTTHGFRTLPLLAVSALQIGEAVAPGLSARTRLIYGELANGAARGITFDSIRRLHDFAHAAALFDSSLDAEPLAKAVESTSPRLALALQRFGLALGANAFDRLEDRRRELVNAMTDLGLRRLTGHLALKVAIGRITHALDQPDLPRQLLALAGLWAERHHYGQALLALTEAATALACPERVREFDDLKKAGNDFAARLDSRQDADDWHALFRLRNRIAHGANLVEQDRVFTEQTLAKRYREAERFVRRLITTST